MTPRRRNRSDGVRQAAAAILAVVVLGGAHEVGRASAPAALARWTATPRLPATGEYHYTLTARVRPVVLFRITCRDVGGARIVRGQAADGARSYELLIGSDPDRAPMRINRWGYVAEITRDATTGLVGVMTESNEESVEDGTATLNQHSRARHPFKAIRASIANGEASAQVVRIALEENFTFRDVGVVLGRLPEGGEPTARIQVPQGSSPGFLGTLADLMHASVSAVRKTGRPAHSQVRAFVYDRGVYDLTLRTSTGVPRLQLGPKTYYNCIESEFHIRNRATRSETGFRLTYATTGPLAEVPVRIVYRPRWWFEAELTLEAWQ